MILSCLAGKAVSEAAVLGTEKQDKADRLAEAEKAARALERRRSKAGTAGKEEGTWQAVE